MRAWKNQDKSWSQIHDSEVFLDFRARMYSLLVGMDEVFEGSVSYLWMPGLLAGFTEEEARAVVHEAILEHLGQEKLGVQSWISPDGLWGGSVERGIYLSPEMKDLYRCLADNGVDAYICSASLELIVETLACDPQLGLGLPPERVFGLRFAPADHLTAVYDSTYVQPIGPGKVTCIQTFMAPSRTGGCVAPRRNKKGRGAGDFSAAPIRFPRALPICLILRERCECPSRSDGPP